MEQRFERYSPDMDALHRGFREKPCFLCEVAEGANELPQHFVYEDVSCFAILDAYPKAYGYTLVAPKEHREQATGDCSVDEYLALQRVVYRVAEAVREEVGAERVYLYSLGSNQGVAHAHWHVVPLPPGVPYGEQQSAWASWSKGVLKIPREEMAALAARLARRVGAGT